MTTLSGKKGLVEWVSRPQSYVTAQVGELRSGLVGR